jgi:hypothetical protein
MGGKSRKQGSISKKLIDRIKNQEGKKTSKKSPELSVGLNIRKKKKKEIEDEYED